MTLTHQLSLFDLLADFQEDDDISNEEILKVLTQMQNETSVVTATQKMTKAAQNTGKTINFSNVSNVANVNKLLFMAGMFFPNSSITINYNFNK